MKKGFTILMALVITFFTVPFGGITALADAEESFEDGTYEIDYHVVYEGDDSPVDVDNFFKKPAILEIQNGVQYIQLGYTATNSILSLNVPGSKVQEVD